MKRKWTWVKPRRYNKLWEDWLGIVLMTIIFMSIIGWFIWEILK